MAKPVVLCKLQKGKVIDAQPNFVDTFNWMVDFINHLRGEKGLEVHNPLGDFPVIRPKKQKGEGDVEVITHLEYSTSDHQLKMTKRKLPKDVQFADKEGEVTTVFTATEIDE